MSDREPASDQEPSPSLPHLWAAVAALALVALSFQIGLPWLEQRVHSVQIAAVPDSLDQRDQGQVLQVTAFADPEVLPVYGSSELTSEMPNRANDFFRSAPTGFRVCPVGKAGNTTILMAQKLASLGDAVRGKKLAIILSFTWFKRIQVPADQYAGNFSRLQVYNLALNREIDPGLMRRLAGRMMEYPGAMESDPVLADFIAAQSEEGMWATGKKAVLWPLVKWNQSMLAWEDRLASAVALKNLAPPATDSAAAPSVPIQWQPLFDQASIELPARLTQHHSDADAETASQAVASFIQRVDTSREWQDLELLLDTLHLLQAKPLVVSIPLAGAFYDLNGVTRAIRDHYYRRLQELCASRGVPLEEFLDHDRDPGFIVGGSTHPTAKGWLYINRLFDDYYHDRLTAPPPKGS